MATRGKYKIMEVGDFFQLFVCAGNGYPIMKSPPMESEDEVKQVMAEVSRRGDKEENYIKNVITMDCKLFFILTSSQGDFIAKSNDYSRQQTMDDGLTIAIATCANAKVIK